MRRAIEIGSALVAVIALGLVLYNATLVDRRPPNVDRIALSLPAGDAHRGQTLTAYIQELLERETTRPPREEVFARIARNGRIRLPMPAAELVRQERPE